MTIIRWETHERDLRPILDILFKDEPPTPLLACFTDGIARWMLFGRSERLDDDADPVTELAVVAAESRPDAMVLATPVRIRDLDDVDAPPIARTWILLSAVLGEGSAELRTRMLPVDGVGVASDLDVEESPAASVFDDARRHRLGEDAVNVIYAACRAGHELAVPAADEALPPAETDALGAPRAPHDAQRAEHRLRRHAADLAARHRPTGNWKQAGSRPAVHPDTPVGWEPACPI